MKTVFKKYAAYWLRLGCVNTETRFQGSRDVAAKKKLKNFKLDRFFFFCRSFIRFRIVIMRVLKYLEKGWNIYQIINYILVACTVLFMKQLLLTNVSHMGVVTNLSLVPALVNRSVISVTWPAGFVPRDRGVRCSAISLLPNAMEFSSSGLRPWRSSQIKPLAPQGGRLGSAMQVAGWSVQQVQPQKYHKK